MVYNFIILLYKYINLKHILPLTIIVNYSIILRTKSTKHNILLLLKMILI